MRLAGGREFRVPTGIVVSANITPDAETGIGKWSNGSFSTRFIRYKEVRRAACKSVPRLHAVRGWLCHLAPPAGRHLPHLKSQPPVHNAVTRPAIRRKLILPRLYPILDTAMLTPEDAASKHRRRYARCHPAQRSDLQGTLDAFSSSKLAASRYYASGPARNSHQRPRRYRDATQPDCTSAERATPSDARRLIPRA
jgi:hypothetical protein